MIGIGKAVDEAEDSIFNVNNNDSIEKKKVLNKREIILNPGANYQIKSDDICFYISLVKEENFEMKQLKSTKSLY